MHVDGRPLLACALLLAACSSGGSVAGKHDLGASSPSDDLALRGEDLAMQQDLAGADAAQPGDAAPSACTPPVSLSRGLAWVRTHPMMISGLSVVMGSPSADAVNDYFDTFHATAAHLWASGLPTEIAGWSAVGRGDFRYISWVKQDGTGTNGMLLGGAAALPGRIGYQIGDEPLDQMTLDTMLASAAAIHAADPDGLTIINVDDESAVDALRAQAIGNAHVDVLSYDSYKYRTSAYGGLNKIRSAALAAGKPYWRYARSYYSPNDSPEITEADMRWDVFLGAVFGFSGLTWFLYQIDPNNPDLVPALFDAKGSYAANKTALYTVAAGLNMQIAQLGRTLSLLTSVDVRYVPALPFNNPDLPVWQKGAGGEGYLSKIQNGAGRDAAVGIFRDDCDERYVIVQNVAHPGAYFPNNGDAATSFHFELDFTGAPAALDRGALESLDLATGAVTSIALVGTGDQRSLDVSIPAGGIVFWKYKDGRPLVRQ